ncbi:MAG: glycoside hydrolase family 13 protein [Bacteroidetes bacterium]|nr:glycoside hydrolase family 13 protein [Bacteroidota bacterium]MDA1335294.1 glycoside hydrolase family 13 protein [Bacteroidota bacterium]
MNMKRAFRSLLGVIILAGSFLISSAQAQSFVDHVDPPFWWLDMPMDTVQIMIHGDRLAQLAPVVDYPGVSIARVVHGDSPNYAFIYLKIERDAEPGVVAIQWRDATDRRGKTVGRTPFELLDRAQRENQQGYNASDAIYLITPDRFSNGDESNDNQQSCIEKLNRDDDHGRHGGDLEGIRMHLDYLSEMGFTAIWLNPILENNQPQWSYHGYATTDYYHVDPRFGTNEAYRQLVDESSAVGMKVIMDMIMNHCGSEHWWMKDLPTADWINHEGVFSPTTHRRTTLRDPYAAKSDVLGFSDGWFVKEMPDLNQRQPLLADYLIQNTIWWIEYLGISGIRMDTYPYSDKDFMARWSCEVMNAYPWFNICGEEWSLNPAVLAYWQADQVNSDGYGSCLPGLLDFPLHHAFMQCLTEEESWHSDWVRLYEMLGNDFLYAHPFNHVIFPDNHDMSRVHTQLGDDVRKTRLALYFFATTRGIPQFYYGTELLMSNTGDDSHGNIRSDFPGGWAGDEVNGFAGDGLSPIEKAFQDEVRKLLNWRKSATAIHQGQLTHFVPKSGAYVYFRENEEQTVMVVLNKSDEALVMDVAEYDEVLAGRRQFSDPINGWTAKADSIQIAPWGAHVFEVD